jgi:dimeric dUTPase (all-alpha-NTP-PPase superfamily)
MKLDLYFEKQRELEQVYMDTLGFSLEEFSSVNMTDKRVYAFKVEFAEFSNETGFFKYWKRSHKMKRQETLEELIDCVHFLLAIGIYRRYDRFVPVIDYTFWTPKPIETLYHEIMNNPISSAGEWKNTFEQLVAIGLKLHYTLDEIQKMYILKNSINVNRQRQNY